MDVVRSIFALSLFSPGLGLILPMSKPNGDPDMNSIISHMTLLEQTVANLQTQVQTTNSKLSTVQGKLQATEDELAAVKTELRSAEVEVARLTNNLEGTPDAMEFALLKSEVEALKKSQGSAVQKPNSIFIDSIKADVKSNTGEIQSLKSQIDTVFHSDLSRLDYKLNETHNLCMSTNIQVKDWKYYVRRNFDRYDVILGELHQELQDVSLSINITDTTARQFTTQLTLIQAEHHSLKSRQNITEFDIEKAKTLGHSNEVSINTLKTQLQKIMLEKDKTDTVVGFQVYQNADRHNISNPLKFDSVDYNIGNGYNKSSGLFTGPVAGTYCFWATVEFYDNSPGFYKVFIKKGQTKLATGVVKTQHVPQYFDVREAVAMTITHLDIGDQIEFTAEGSKGWIDNESSYGGALLHAD